MGHRREGSQHEQSQKHRQNRGGAGHRFDLGIQRQGDRRRRSLSPFPFCPDPADQMNAVVDRDAQNHGGDHHRDGIEGETGEPHDAEERCHGG